MKTLLFIVLLTSFIIAKTPSHIEVLNPKKGHFRFNNTISFSQSDLDSVNLFQILNTTSVKYGLKSKLMLQLSTLSTSSWTQQMSVVGTSADYLSKFHLLSFGISKNFSAEQSDFGLLCFLRTPLISKQYFYDNNMLESETERLNYIYYGFSYYKLTPPLVPTIQLSQKVFFDDNNFIPGNEFSINFNINFSVNDDWTLLWGAAYQNTQTSSLYNQETDVEKNTIFFNYGMLYDISRNLTFKISCSFNFSQEDTSTISFKTSYRL